jgi:predicted 2-oxoglutarate/Fe(II)-dependent dioxygenase YbiX
MNDEVKPAWSFVEDSTSQVPGVMIPSDNATPYFTSRLLDEAEADELYHAVIAQYARKQLHRVYQADGKGDQIDLNSRYTHAYEFYSLPNAQSLEARFNAEVERVARMWWNKQSIPVYSPQILGYEEKCRFRTHCDNSIWKDGGWFQNDPMRDVTALLYISECVPTVTRPNQHSGGTLVLDNILMGNSPVRIVPKKGQFVMFPSHPVFRHQVTPVTRGYRVALVNWWSLR